MAHIQGRCVIATDVVRTCTIAEAYADSTGDIDGEIDGVGSPAALAVHPLCLLVGKHVVGCGHGEPVLVVGLGRRTIDVLHVVGQTIGAGRKSCSVLINRRVVGIPTALETEAILISCMSSIGSGRSDVSLIFTNLAIAKFSKATRKVCCPTLGRCEVGIDYMIGEVYVLLRSGSILEEKHLSNGHVSAVSALDAVQVGDALVCYHLLQVDDPDVVAVLGLIGFSTPIVSGDVDELRCGRVVVVLSVVCCTVHAEAGRASRGHDDEFVVSREVGIVQPVDVAVAIRQAGRYVDVVSATRSRAFLSLSGVALEQVCGEHRVALSKL